MIGLGNIVEEREAQVREAIARLKEEASDQRRLQMLLQVLSDIREAITNSVVDKVTIKNFDEVKASLHNELNRISKPIVAALDSLKIPSEELARIKADIERKNVLVLDEDADIQITRKPKQRLEISNISDIRFPSSINIDNLGDLQAYFDSLADVIRETFSIDIPTPQVVVNPPNVYVPDIHIPETSVNIDLDRVIKALEPLKFISDRPNKAISVRIAAADGKRFLDVLEKIKETNERQVQAFANSTGLSKKDFTNAIRNVDDVLAPYKITDKDDDASPNYYGFTKPDGSWYILKETVSAGADTYRYAVGTSAYTTNWTNRATSVTYSYFYEVF